MNLRLGAESPALAASSPASMNRKVGRDSVEPSEPHRDFPSLSKSNFLSVAAAQEKLSH